MTQKELNQLYKSLWDKYVDPDDEDEADPDRFTQEYYGAIGERGAVVLGCDWKEYGLVVDDFIKLMEKHGFVVLENPDCEGSDQYGWVIWEPKGMKP